MRIGIVGTENSHAEDFIRYLNVGRTRFPEHRITGLADGPAARNQQLAQLGEIDLIVDHAADLIGHIDAVIVCSRDGRRHRDQALAPLEASLPVFVDKPLACDLADAKDLLAAADRHANAISSFSSLRWTSEVTTLASRLNAGGTDLVAVSGPADASSEYGGIFFYGVHVVEIALALTDHRPLREVTVADCDDAVIATAVAGNTNVLMEFVKPTGAVVPWRIATIGSHGSTAQQLRLGRDYDFPAMGAILDMFESGVRPLPEHELLAPIQTLVAIEQAIIAGT
jgi:predicted dehydrogenase